MATNHNKLASVYVHLKRVETEKEEGVNYLWNVAKNVLDITIHKTNVVEGQPINLDNFKTDLKRSAFSELGYISLN